MGGSGGYHVLRPLLRSLLQKAVRRGCVELVSRVTGILARMGDSKWINSRSAIIAFEECWMIALVMKEMPSSHFLELIASSKKNKAAAGLGDVAYGCMQGGVSLLELDPDYRSHVKIVAAGAIRSKDFFSWVKSRAETEQQLRLIEAGQRTFTQATWPWDKVFAIAGSYLALEGVDIVEGGGVCSMSNFPYWVAVDKHTPQGKVILKDLAKSMKVSFDVLSTISFFCEGSQLNSSVYSSWWELSAATRLRSHGLTMAEAEVIWSDCKVGYISAAEQYSKQLKEFVVLDGGGQLF